MNKFPAISLFLSGLLGVSILSFAADSIEPPTPDSTGPTNPTPPTLPAPGSGDPNGNGIETPPAPGSNGTDGQAPEAQPPTPNQPHLPEQDGPGQRKSSGNE